MKSLWLSIFVLIGLAGCVAPVEMDYFIVKNYAAVDSLLASSKVVLDKKSPIIVATLVDIDKLNESSRLGRVISEQAAARLSKVGYLPIELKLRNNLYIKKQEGELLLSREVKEIAESHKTHFVVVGTYSASSDHVYINLKIVDTVDNTIVAAHDYVLPRDREIDSLLNTIPYIYPILNIRPSDE
jgi:TolB-like protein